MVVLTFVASVAPAAVASPGQSSLSWSYTPPFETATRVWQSCERSDGERYFDAVLASYDASSATFSGSGSAHILPPTVGDVPVPAADRKGGKVDCRASSAMVKHPLPHPPSKDGVLDIRIEYSVPEREALVQEDQEAPVRSWASSTVEANLTVSNDGGGHDYWIGAHHCYNAGSPCVGVLQPGDGVVELQVSGVGHGRGTLFFSWTNFVHVLAHEAFGNTKQALADAAMTMQVRRITITS